MLTVRRAEDRGHSDLGWLSSHHTFSFGGYSDPRHMGFRSLRVINDDRVAAGKGFGAHGHRDMEILSYVVDGRLAHKDSMGEAHELGPNEVQAMSAGNGVIHSEYNASETEATHFLQIWIMPAEKDIEPSYQQFAYDPAEKRGRLRLMAGPEAQGGAARIHQDARMYATVLAAGESVTCPIAGGRYASVQGVTGDAAVNSLTATSSHAVTVSDEAEVVLRGTGPSGAELLVFDLA